MWKTAETVIKGQERANLDGRRRGDDVKGPEGDRVGQLGRRLVRKLQRCQARSEVPLDVIAEPMRAAPRKRPAATRSMIGVSFASVTASRLSNQCLLRKSIQLAPSRIKASATRTEGGARRSASTRAGA